ncbi:hypothetical protein A3759_17645 [Thalassolituus sp. HI0120]|nr:hypothetical protein A3759_17645 [Thalassolituus sp. HI0120]
MLGVYGFRSIVAVIFPENMEPLVVSTYIVKTEASFEKRNEAIVKIGKQITQVYTQNSVVN